MLDPFIVLFAIDLNIQFLVWFWMTVNNITWQGTVEESMEAVQARKPRMIPGALTDQEVQSARIQELKMLFT